jgi:hypothetical protein
MKERLAGLISRARQLESAIQTRIEGRARPHAAGVARQPLELVHALVRSIEQEVQPAGRGQVVFPYTQIRIWIAASSPRDRARLAAACEGPPSLQDRIADRLAAAHCEGTGLQVKTAFVAKGKDDWIDRDFHLEYARIAPAALDAAPPARIDLTVLKGTAEKTSYSFMGGAGGTVSLGRGTDVRDDRDRLIRTNQVAFVQGAGDINASVSRRHARIEHDPASGLFRLHDDGASQGTSVIRDGRGLTVPRARGLRLRSGDVIVLGEARVRVRLHD